MTSILLTYNAVKNVSKWLLQPSKINCNKYDIVIIGGGIIGTAVGREILKKYKSAKVAILEKENQLAQHQSSHNSGVIHSGVYYSPNSLKADFCTKGLSLIYDYLETNKIPYVKCGKLIIATEKFELLRLESLYKQALENKLNCKLLNNCQEVKEVNANCKGIQAIWIPETGNVNWADVTKCFAREFFANKGDIFCKFHVKNVEQSSDPDYPITIKSTDNEEVLAKYAIVCAGMQSSNLTEMIGSKNEHKLMSLRVNYQIIDKPVATNIYKVPDITMPFLGLHLSPTTDNKTLFGPSAIPAFNVEGYCPTDINFSYVKDTVMHCHVHKMISNYFYNCWDQVVKTVWVDKQVQELQSVVPSVSYRDLSCGYSAILPSLIDKDGHFVNDFIFEYFEGSGIRKRIINCKFLPSPAATASIAIAEHLVDKLSESDVKYLNC